MNVFSFLNQKGGVGKTTLALNFATALAMIGQKVLFIDADEQGSSLDWAAERENQGKKKLFTIETSPTDTLYLDIAELSAPYHYTVIDGVPGKNTNTKSVVAASNMVVIPVKPSPLDIWATNPIVDMILEARKIKPDLRAVFVLNGKVENTAVARSIREKLAEQPFPTLKSEITQRVSFAESLAYGLSVPEIDPRGKATVEILSLTREILEEYHNEQEPEVQFRSAREEASA